MPSDSKLLKWSFPSNNGGQINGISDSGIETFKGTPIKSLAREICQNSLDARRDSDIPVRIEFSLFEIEPSQIPNRKALEDAFLLGSSFWSSQKSSKAKTFYKNALSIIRSQRIPCLRISDYNTTGLTGAQAEYNSPWSNLIKSQGASDKSGSNGGSFGIGKFAPFACSSLRTVFYSTSDIEGVCAYQGVCRITSFKDNHGKITQGVGFCGKDNKNTPILKKQFSLDPNFSRADFNHGTDIFIVGFNGDGEWKNQMVASVLDGFLYAVYNGTLIADVNGVVISRETLPTLIETCKEYFQEHAEEYYQTLTDEKASQIFEKEINGDPDIAGKLTLKMLIMPGFHRKAAMIRETGMKIKDKGNISGLIPFAGVLYIEGDAVNSYLRSLENPQHLEWEIGRAENQAKAKRLLSFMTKFIKDSLEEMKNDDKEEALDPSVGEYLSAMPENAAENQEKTEAVRDSIQDFKVRIVEALPKSSDLPSDNAGLSLIEDENGPITASDVPGDGGAVGSASGGGSHSGHGSGTVPNDHNKCISAVAPVNVRCVVRSKKEGEYSIIYTPDVSAVDGYLDVFMSAESQNYKAQIKSVRCKDCPDAAAVGNRISGLAFAKGKALRVDITLDYHDYCSLEVKAYGIQA